MSQFERWYPFVAGLFVGVLIDFNRYGPAAGIALLAIMRTIQFAKAEGRNV